MYKLLRYLCPVFNKLEAKTRDFDNLAKLHNISTTRLQMLEDVVATANTLKTKEVDKIAVSAHAVHRYKERFNGKGSDHDISRMLYKALLKQLYTTDRLQDGKYDLLKSVVGVVENNTLVTVLPKHAAKKQS